MARAVRIVRIQCAKHSRSTISPHTYALMGRRGNIGVFVGADEIFVVDSQYEDLTESILETIVSIASKPFGF